MPGPTISCSTNSAPWKERPCSKCAAVSPARAESGSNPNRARIAIRIASSRVQWKTSIVSPGSSRSIAASASASIVSAAATTRSLWNEGIMIAREVSW